MEILVFSQSITPRLQYAANIMLSHILGHNVIITSNSEEFIRSSLVKINYSPNEISGSLQIHPVGLLFENAIKYVDPGFKLWNKVPLLFYNSAEDSLPFDPFAATFWMVTRYEEYLPFKKDLHKRFTATISLGYKKGFLSEPVVHLWADALAKEIEKLFPQFKRGKQNFSSISTIDVDNAWAYLNKDFIRIAGASARDLLTGNFKGISQRWKTIRGAIPDPFDTYSYFEELHLAMDIHPKWFFLLADYGTFDKNIDPTNKQFQQLIRVIARNADVGLHPSYASNESPDKLEKEKDRLENITGISVSRSRQHYLKLSLPYTYRNLIKLGITEDYSMGYHDQTGFRAGICVPYPWFDLEENHQENLTLFPFQLMDRTFTEYLHLPATIAFDIIKELIDKTAGVNGLFISIWHNEPADMAEPASWLEIYRKMLTYIYELK